jgi:hypothetical protein
MPGCAARMSGVARAARHHVGDEHARAPRGLRKPSATSCSNAATTVLRASPQPSASARLDGSRRAGGSVPSSTMVRIAAWIWRPSAAGARAVEPDRIEQDGTGHAHGRM